MTSDLAGGAHASCSNVPRPLLPTPTSPAGFKGGRCLSCRRSPGVEPFVSVHRLFARQEAAQDSRRNRGLSSAHATTTNGANCLGAKHSPPDSRTKVSDLFAAALANDPTAPQPAAGLVAQYGGCGNAGSQSRRVEFQLGLRWGYGVAAGPEVNVNNFAIAGATGRTRSAVGFASSCAAIAICCARHASGALSRLSM
jgi:hypothetical protein